MKHSGKGYLHGYSPEEQERLFQQARFLEHTIYESVDLSGERLVLEVGCGVGAQTEILLRRFPKLTVHGIDASKVQIQRARKYLTSAISAKRVQLSIGDALALPYESNVFDGAFLCWFLEHVEKPNDVLREIHRVLKPGGVLYCNEVLNATFFIHPYSPATLQYWFHYNDHQWNLGGDPFVGAKLGNYLSKSGYQKITTTVKNFHYDNRAQKRRAEMIERWTSLLLSGTPELIAAKRVTSKLVTRMREELERLKNDPDAVFFYSFIQARAEAS